METLPYLKTLGHQSSDEPSNKNLGHDPERPSSGLITIPFI